MFTGLIRELGTAVSLRRKAAGAALAVKAPLISREIVLGGSVAVNGACLTVTRINGDLLDFDLSDETLESTTLGGLKPGERVNLEPALKAADPLGGHMVTGHVDAVGRMRSRKKTGEMYKIEVECPREVLKFLVEKGSVAVDGISLTVVDVLADSFTIVIIPHTAQNTTSK